MTALPGIPAAAVAPTAGAVPAVPVPALPPDVPRQSPTAPSSPSQPSQPSHPPSPGRPAQPRGADGGLRVLDAATTERTEVVYPGMCGPLSLFAARAGDWTWESVSALTGTDVLTATDGRGNPAYLSFCYYRIRSGPGCHPGALSFGDRLRVTTGLYGFGSESVLALHHITPGPDAAGTEPPAPDADGLGDRPAPGTLRVENFNRWISRSRPGSNESLVRASPPGFRHEHLPPPPDEFTPRIAVRRARTAHTLLTDAELDGRTLTHGPLLVPCDVDTTRDLNGAGLLYFAAYFAYIDRAVHALGRELGGSDAAFLGRAVHDVRLAYLGNASAGARLELSVRLLCRPGAPADQLYDITVREAGSARLLAVAAVHQTSEEPNHDAHTS